MGELIEKFISEAGGRTTNCFKKRDTDLVDVGHLDLRECQSCSLFALVLLMSMIAPVAPSVPALSKLCPFEADVECAVDVDVTT